jgi:hypothetical protein
MTELPDASRHAGPLTLWRHHYGPDSLVIVEAPGVVFALPDADAIELVGALTDLIDWPDPPDPADSHDPKPDAIVSHVGIDPNQSLEGVS